MSLKAKQQRGRRAGGADDKAVLKRAARLHRAYLREKILPRLGLPAEATDEQVEAKLDEMKKRVDDVEAGNSPDALKQVDALKQEVALLKKKAIKAIKHAKALEAETEDRKVEAEIRETALLSGVRDVEYAQHLFRNHVRTLPEGSPEPDPKAFFAELKKDETKKYLFEGVAVPAGTKTLAEEKKTEQTAPPPVAASETQTPTGEQTPPVDATKMSRAEFREHQRKTYGIGSVTSSVN